MGHNDSKVYQLRVRITAEERDLLDALRLKRNRGETLSDLVREAISLLIKPHAGGDNLSPHVRTHVERLAELLKRQPRQVEESCVEGIVDLIERRCEVPLIVMETQLHLKYRGKDQKAVFPWSTPAHEMEPDPAPLP
jgi:hypothetical protein